MTDSTIPSVPNSDDISAYQAPSAAPQTPMNSPMSMPSMPVAAVTPSIAPITPVTFPPTFVRPVSGISAQTPVTPAVPAAMPAMMTDMKTELKTDMEPDMKPASATTSTAPKSDPESLEAQNIFALLGVNDGADGDKEAFLDELQEVIWQDFLANDLQLLLTKEELDQVKAMQAKTSDLAKQQEEIVGFLETLIPDLEDIMLEKALELKRQMVQERVTGLREYLAGKPDQLMKLDSVEQLIKQNQWAHATQVLNALQ